MNSEQIVSGVLFIFACIIVILLIVNTSFKSTSLQRQLGECNEAISLLVFNTTGKNWGAVLFHKLHAIDRVLEFNLLHLEDHLLVGYKSEFKSIKDGVEDAVTRSLTHYKTDIEDLPAIGHEQEIKELNELYKELVVFAIESQNNLLQLVAG